MTREDVDVVDADVEAGEVVRVLHAISGYGCMLYS